MPSYDERPRTINTSPRRTPRTRCSLHVLHDEAKDKPFELEMSWVCEETEWKYQGVPQNQVMLKTWKGEIAPFGGKCSLPTRHMRYNLYPRSFVNSIRGFDSFNLYASPRALTKLTVLLKVTPCWPLLSQQLTSVHLVIIIEGKV